MTNATEKEVHGANGSTSCRQLEGISVRYPGILHEMEANLLSEWCPICLTDYEVSKIEPILSVYGIDMSQSAHVSLFGPCLNLSELGIIVSSFLVVQCFVSCHDRRESPVLLVKRRKARDTIVDAVQKLPVRYPVYRGKLLETYRA